MELRPGKTRQKTQTQLTGKRGVIVTTVGVGRVAVRQPGQDVGLVQLVAQPQARRVVVVAPPALRLSGLQEAAGADAGGQLQRLYQPGRVRVLRVHLRTSEGTLFFDIFF